MRRITTTLTAVLAAGSLLALAACAEVEPPEERLAAAADVTRAGGSAAFTMDIAFKLEAAEGPVQTFSSGEGVVDFAGETGRMELGFPLGGVSITTLFGPEFLYVRLPPEAGVDGPEWIGGTPREMEDITTDPVGMGSDPTGIFRALDARIGEITPLGRERVRDVEVEGFGFRVSSEELGDEEAEDLPPGLEFPVEVWLDAENRIRKTVLEMDLRAIMDAFREAEGELPEEAPPMMEQMAGILVLTTEFHDFGVEVDVELPDEADVMSIQEARELMGPAPPDG